MRPTDLRVDEAVSPLWVTGAPTSAGSAHDVDRGEIQTAYRIVVRTAPTGDPKSHTIVWDSGRVRSSSESFVTAPGLELPPDQRY